jgi:hypothetical protein
MCLTKRNHNALLAGNTNEALENVGRFTKLPGAITLLFFSRQTCEIFLWFVIRAVSAFSHMLLARNSQKFLTTFSAANFGQPGNKNFH